MRSALHMIGWVLFAAFLFDVAYALGGGYAR